MAKATVLPGHLESGALHTNYTPSPPSHQAQLHPTEHVWNCSSPICLALADQKPRSEPFLPHTGRQQVLWLQFPAILCHYVPHRTMPSPLVPEHLQWLPCQSPLSTLYDSPPQRDQRLPVTSLCHPRPPTAPFHSREHQSPWRARAQHGLVPISSLSSSLLAGRAKLGVQPKVLHDSNCSRLVFRKQCVSA